MMDEARRILEDCRLSGERARGLKRVIDRLVKSSAPSTPCRDWRGGSVSAGEERLFFAEFKTAERLLPELAEKVERLREEQNRLVGEMCGVWLVVEEIKKPRLRSFLEQRYVLNMSWEDVAKAMGYTVDGIRGLDSRAVEAFARELGKNALKVLL